jgi:uncharacterized protein (DUF1684 family)
MTDAPTISADALEAEVRLYRQARLSRLTAPTGWLALVNKAWLAEGSWTIGSDPDCDIVLPDRNAPARLGRVTRTGLEVHFETAPGVTANARGGPITSLSLRSDAESAPDRVTVGSLEIELIRRGDDLALRVRDPDSPARRAFAGVPTYAVDPAFWITARFHTDDTPIRIELTDSDGRPQLQTSVGTVTFEIAATPCRLRLFEEGDGRRVFVPFGDVTNRTETYGAGRFLYAPLPADDHVILDFNKAFNPPCAFTPFAACPLPPADNRLSVRVEAGEKRPDPHD